MTLLALSACGSGNSGNAGSGDGAPKSGGTLTFAVGSDAGCVDPQQVGSNDTIYSLRQIVDSLTDQDPATGKIVPWLAQSWEVSADATTFTFHLKPGVTFSDGTPVNAQAVKDNFDAALKLGAKASLAIGYLSGYDGTTVVDDLTAAVKFKQPNAQFLQATSTFSLGLVSGASVAQDRRPAVHRGHRRLRAVRAGEVRREPVHHAGPSAPGTTGVRRCSPRPARPTSTSSSSRSSRRPASAAAACSPVRSTRSAPSAWPTRARSRAPSTCAPEPTPGAVFNLGLNNSRPLLAELAVRQALLLAIDRKQIADTIFPTGSKPATSILASTTPDYTDTSATIRLDAAKAKSLLDTAGWVPGADGIRTKGGTRLSLTVAWFANAATNQPTLELVQQQLKAVGVEIKLRQLQIAQVTQVQQAGDFDAFWGNLTRADPDILRSLFSTELANVYRLPPGELDQIAHRPGRDGRPDQAAEPGQPGPATRRRQRLRHPGGRADHRTGGVEAVHDLNFEASSRIQLHDTWKS